MWSLTYATLPIWYINSNRVYANGVLVRNIAKNHNTSRGEMTIAIFVGNNHGWSKQKCESIITIRCTYCQVAFREYPQSALEWVQLLLESSELSKIQYHYHYCYYYELSCVYLLTVYSLLSYVISWEGSRQGVAPEASTMRGVRPCPGFQSATAPAHPSQMCHTQLRVASQMCHTQLRVASQMCHTELVKVWPMCHTQLRVASQKCNTELLVVWQICYTQLLVVTNM
jgi:hypothetical protein